MTDQITAIFKDIALENGLLKYENIYFDSLEECLPKCVYNRKTES